MPSRKLQAGDPVAIRGIVVAHGGDFLQVLVDDGYALSITQWVPARECAAPEDFHLLKPIRRKGGFLER
jgi:hypothetical protein